MFRGVTELSLDAKGRFAMPTRYRQELQECCGCQLVVTVAVNERCMGEPGCLWLYPLAEWEKLEITISKLPTLNKMAGKLRRFVIGHAFELEMDAQGRLLLPDKLRKFAGIEKKLMLVGQLNKFEIWSTAAWIAKENEWLNDSDDDLDELSDLSF